MIEFKSIFYRNLQSVGNSGITIELNRSQTTLLGGSNGSGKCVDKFTELDVNFKDNTTEELFMRFMKNR